MITNWFTPILCFCSAISPLVYKIVTSKSKKIKYIFLGILAIGLVIFLTAFRLLAEMNLETRKLFNSGKLVSEEDGIDYMDYVIESDKNIKNILLIGSDQRPNSLTNNDFRTDMMFLISIDEDTDNINVFSLSRDTLVKRNAVSSDIRKLNEVTSYGGVQSLVNCIRLNYGINIDEYILVNWRCFVDFIDVFFKDGVAIKLNEIEMIGINQSLPEQNKTFFISENKSENITEEDIYKDMLCDPITGDERFGLDELNYLKKNGQEESLYDINENLKGSPYTRYFDESNVAEINLNGNQLLSYCRLRHAYPNQANQREYNNLKLFVELFPQFLRNITDKNVVDFTKKCVDNGSIQTSYESFQALISDFFIPLKSVHMGKVVEFEGGASRRVTSIPMVYTNNYGEGVIISYTYESLYKQSERLIYNK